MSHNPLITTLQNSSLYDHPIKAFQVIETHISWVILTGDYAYKLKKPVDFEFLNYSTLEKRFHYCQEEVRLNKHLAPEIYCGVVPIYGSVDKPSFTANGAIIDYAVKMREFSQDSLFSQLLTRNELTTVLIDELAKIIADFHIRAQQALAENEFGSPAHVHAPVVQNFDQIRPMLTDTQDLQQLDRLATWAQQQYQQLERVFAQRKAQGFVRECHGDIYLNNIILWQGRPVIFDCIEFNEDFRWTDVMADIGFLAMDLEDNQQPALAHQLINNYLKYSGDYAGLSVLSYYQAYRAVVRAKVALFRLMQPGLAAQELTAIRNTYRSYMALAERYSKPQATSLMITHGFSGSGKSTLAKEVMLTRNAIHITADIERKRQAGLTSDAQTNSGLNADLYSFEQTAKNYQRLAELAAVILNAGYPVIVDATFLKLQQRNLFQDLAQRLAVPFAILSCQGTADFLQQSVLRRKQAISEADLNVLAMQQETHELLTEQEQAKVLEIMSHRPLAKNELQQQLNALLVV